MIGADIDGANAKVGPESGRKAVPRKTRNARAAGACPARRPGARYPPWFSRMIAAAAACASLATPSCMRVLTAGVGGSLSSAWPSRLRVSTVWIHLRPRFFID
ncbi:hypothetical protein [Burkholderia ambifaria]|uniref:hypothetical protein n=1 Tax=Burkholderia ambifaria TaxID=152480 RepID=UPI00158DAA77|nr:hypothetical protein [Burkholderia ambifaria]WDS00119.1 hypothetical protein OR985_06960 [Burkholderia ambifaria]